MWEDFKRFMTSPNVLDWAVGVVIGTAFGRIIDSFVNDIITPPIGLLLGHVDFRDLFLNLGGGHYHSLPQAQAAGAATINYGAFINTVLNFLLVSVIVYLLVRQLHASGRPRGSLPATKLCPYCRSNIPVHAIRCPYCTSNLSSRADNSNDHGGREAPVVIVGSQEPVRRHHSVAPRRYEKSTSEK
ncbi:large conductance mechanosensitive channel protein MscL [Alicyclobacillus kakegawensis]|uniref:large conductance mechanosensitive channel protein MscL n=1 Tax=Alicyclobacillus kakegawensis TaxID=392012 RepID=UPI0009F9B878|nr:large conductance mechanosensitive channel protein MscL [Alicyclobacillus kakegawensis]